MKDNLEFIFYLVTALSTFVAAIVAVIEVIRKRKRFAMRIAYEYHDKKLKTIKIIFMNKSDEDVYPYQAYFATDKKRGNIISIKELSTFSISPNQQSAFRFDISSFEAIKDRSNKDKIKIIGCVILQDGRKIYSKNFMLEKKKFFIN